MRRTGHWPKIRAIKRRTHLILSNSVSLLIALDAIEFTAVVPLSTAFSNFLPTSANPSTATVVIVINAEFVVTVVACLFNTLFSPSEFCIAFVLFSDVIISAFTPFIVLIMVTFTTLLLVLFVLVATAVAVVVAVVFVANASVFVAGVVFVDATISNESFCVVDVDVADGIVVDAAVVTTAAVGVTFAVDCGAEVVVTVVELATVIADDGIVVEFVPLVGMVDESTCSFCSFLDFIVVDVDTVESVVVLEFPNLVPSSWPLDDN